MDKSIGISSNACLQEVKSLFHARKAGHTGSLDPLASGLLPICLGEATKISSFLLNKDKRYSVTIELGVATSTGDAEGEIINRRKIPALSENRVSEVLRGFVGKMDQIPPMYSAVKHKGVRLYELARQGIDVERKPRKVTIFELILKQLGVGSLNLEVHCSKGTYIRSLAEAIGLALGSCAYVGKLRRTEVGDFRISDAWQLDKLRVLADTSKLSACLISLDDALKSWSSVRLSNQLASYVKQGQEVFAEHAPSQGWVKLYTRNNELFGIAQIKDDGKVAPRRLFNLIAQ